MTVEPIIEEQPISINSSEDWPQGLNYIPNFITNKEEITLIKHIQQLEWQAIALFGQTAKRTVVHYGLDYNYSKRTVLPTIPPPAFLNDVIGRGAALLNVPHNEIAEILITQYPLNAGINWHRDSPVFKDIIGLSLYSPCTIDFRNRLNKKERFNVQLERGSAYLLTDAIRWEWEHRILPVKTHRYSITLRTLSSL